MMSSLFLTRRTISVPLLCEVVVLIGMSWTILALLIRYVLKRLRTLLISLLILLVIIGRVDPPNVDELINMYLLVHSHTNTDADESHGIAITDVFCSLVNSYFTADVTDRVRGCNVEINKNTSLSGIALIRGSHCIKTFVTITRLVPTCTARRHKGLTRSTRIVSPGV